jgi:hypothetical protein
LVLLDSDWRVVAHNQAADGLFQGSPEFCLVKSNGEVAGCFRPQGAVKGCAACPSCEDCPLRRAGERALETSKATRCAAVARITDREGTRVVPLWIVASPLLLGPRESILILLEGAPKAGKDRLLPICAVCKKIRDESDDWHRLEEYLQAYQNVTFTHSLCPECAPGFFPQPAKPAEPRSGTN